MLGFVGYWLLVLCFADCLYVCTGAERFGFVCVVVFACCCLVTVTVLVV